MEQLDRLFRQLVPLCERCINPIVVVYCLQKVAVGIMLTYIGVGAKLGENAALLHSLFQLFALAFYKDAYECFAGPLLVVSATENLLKEVNRLRTVVPVEQLVEVEHVVAYLKDQNAFWAASHEEYALEHLRFRNGCVGRCVCVYDMTNAGK